MFLWKDIKVVGFFILPRCLYEGDRFEKLRFGKPRDQHVSGDHREEDPRRSLNQKARDLLGLSKIFRYRFCSASSGSGRGFFEPVTGLARFVLVV